jgi:hypothetical protein
MNSSSVRRALLLLFYPLFVEDAGTELLVRITPLKIMIIIAITYIVESIVYLYELELNLLMTA